MPGDEIWLCVRCQEKRGTGHSWRYIHDWTWHLKCPWDTTATHIFPQLLYVFFFCIKKIFFESCVFFYLRPSFFSNCRAEVHRWYTAGFILKMGVLGTHTLSMSRNANAWNFFEVVLTKVVQKPIKCSRTSWDTVEVWKKSKNVNHNWISSKNKGWYRKGIAWSQIHRHYVMHTAPCVTSNKLSSCPEV